MEQFMELLAGLGIDYSDLITIAAAIILLVLKKWRGDKLVQDVLHVARVAYSAIEEAGSKNIKTIVGASIKESAEKIPQIEVINDILHTVVDEKRAAAAADPEDISVPPIKRFWRRMLSGKNLAGVALRIAGKKAVKDLLEDD